MKKSLKITLIVIIGIIALIFALNEYSYTKSYDWENLESTNQNIRFIDKLGYHYWYNNSFQTKDGSVYILSSMSDRSWFKNYASIIKLNPEGNVLWETKAKLGKFKWADLLPHIFRNQEQSKESDIGIYDFSTWQDKIYILVFEDKGKTSEAQIWSFDLQGKLLEKRAVNYNLESDASIQITMQNNSIYISKLGEKDKQIHLIKINCKDAKLVFDKTIKSDQKIPQVWALASDMADSTVAISVIDNKTEAFTIYKYTDREGIKELYKSQPLSRIDALTFADVKLYESERKDSLLLVKDITQPDNPKVLVQDKLNVMGGATDLLVKGDSVFVGLTYWIKNTIAKKKTNIQPQNMEVMVRKYTPTDKPFDYKLQGKSTEMYGKMYIMPDNHLLVMGYSFSTSYLKCMRLFATKFKL